MAESSSYPDPDGRPNPDKTRYPEEESMAYTAPTPTDPSWQDTAVQPEPYDTAGVGTAQPTDRRIDGLALAAGLVFSVVAVLGLIGTSLPNWVLGGGLIAILLVVGGAALLITELRRSRG